MKVAGTSYLQYTLRLFIGLLIGLFLIVVVQKIKNDFTLLTTAQSDNLQWNVMQAEVEFRRYEAELLKFAVGLAETGDTARLAHYWY